MNKIIENEIIPYELYFDNWIKEDVEVFRKNCYIHTRGRYSDMYRLYILKDVRAKDKEDHFKRMGLSRFL